MYEPWLVGQDELSFVLYPSNDNSEYIYKNVSTPPNILKYSIGDGLEKRISGTKQYEVTSAKYLWFKPYFFINSIQ